MSDKYERDITKPHKQSIKFSVDEETFVLFVYMAKGNYLKFKNLMWNHNSIQPACPPYHLMPRRSKDEMQCFYCYDCYHCAYDRVKVNKKKQIIKVMNSEYKFDYLDKLEKEYLENQNKERSDKIAK